MLTTRDKMIAAQPLCIFCGGIRNSETVEHMPSRNMFTGRHRPKGLEFAACRHCNESTRKDEQIAAMLSRTFPNPRNRDERLELRKIISNALRFNPGLIKELAQDQVPVLSFLKEKAFKLPHWNFIQIGPICQRALRRFGYKLGAALHYDATGDFLPIGGGVFTDIYSNVDAFTSAYPKEFSDFMGQGRTLSAGKWQVGDQFKYVSDAPPDATETAHLAVFREGFALSMLVCADLSRHEYGPKDGWCRVGEL